MLAESLTALAAAGGAAVVQAATTDAWTGLRGRVARWFGRGDDRRVQVQLERLDRTAAELTASGGAEREQELQERAWRTRFEDLLEGLDDTEREEAAAELRALLEESARAGGAAAGVGAVAAGRDLSVKAEGGSIAAAVVQGGAHIGHPPMPDPSQG
ncbi:hypothetical protein PV721_21210 [Streptomyces sp. MB09-01]|uniref:hypothetical protein n=1 Tax=Streptomyces sp. MB09-01 TaxID=3028666 RepID=UPI0029B054FF|nr:hypothetical protein [Streptomyces sp. MB09-01]MDX3536847.1 hypothetical protein [Streptomyces sp. MB09-01]